MEYTAYIKNFQRGLEDFHLFGYKNLTKEEYKKLLETANSLGKDRLSLLMEAICATGIRGSEVKYITVEAVQAGRTDVSLKGKIRTILIPGKLCRKLQKYAKTKNRFR